MTQEEPDDMARKPESKLSLVQAAESALIPAEDAIDAAEQAIRPEGEGKAEPAVASAPNGDGEFPSPHILYLAAVKNDLDAQVMRFRNAWDMLSARIKGAETAFKDEIQTLEDEYRKRVDERKQAHLAEVLRLNTQMSDIGHVVDTYETAIAKAAQIAENEASVEKGMHEALKPNLENER